MIPYGRQSIDQADIDAVVDVLRSDFLTQGPAVRHFEEALERQCRAQHAVAFNSATSALHVACLALDVGPGDRVWTSPITFVASANCALYCGASVDFVDIDPGTYNMSPDRLAEKLEAAVRTGTLPKVVIPVHLGGQSCDMVAIRGLAERYGFRIIEDASHAVGAHYLEHPVGECRYSDVTVFSFHPVKIVTTGEGGAATSSDSMIAGRMALMRSHGITRDEAAMTRTPEGPWYYEQLTLGFNYRMPDILAALGASQMRRLDALVARRRAIAKRYDEAFADQQLTYQRQAVGTASSYHLYITHFEREDPEEHRLIFELLRNKRLGVNLHYMPVYLQPYYRSLGFKPGLCPAAERYYAGAISIPLYPDMSDADVETVINAVCSAAKM